MTMQIQCVTITEESRTNVSRQEETSVCSQLLQLKQDHRFRNTYNALNLSLSWNYSCQVATISHLVY